MIQLYFMNTHFWSFLDLGPTFGWVKNKQIVGRKNTFEILAQLKWRKNHIKGQQTFSTVCKLQPVVPRSTLLAIYKSFIELHNEHDSILYN